MLTFCSAIGFTKPENNTRGRDSGGGGFGFVTVTSIRDASKFS